MGLLLRPGVGLGFSVLPRSRPLPDARCHAPSKCCCRPSAPRTILRPAAARCLRTGATAKWNIVSRSSCTGTQFVQSVGAAEATLYYEHRQKALAQAKKAPLGKHVNHASDEIVYVSAGDGATSEGEFWESLNAACAKKLPLLYVIEDNGYAISVPVEVQTAGGSISRLVRSFPGLHRRGMRRHRSARKLRGRQGSRRILPRAPRPRADSRARHAPLLAFAFRRRKTLQDSRRARKRSASRPLSKFSLFLVREGLLDQKEIEHLEAEVDREVRDAADEALAAEQPTVDSIRVNVYSPDIDPTSRAFEAQPQLHGAPKTMVEMVAATLSDEMCSRRTHHRLRRRRRRRQSRRKSQGRKREGRRLQGHFRLAAQIWRRPRL